MSRLELLITLAMMRFMMFIV